MGHYDHFLDENAAPPVRSSYPPPPPFTGHADATYPPTITEMVREFHQKFDHPVGVKRLDKACEEIDRRINLIDEEYEELLDTKYGSPEWLKEICDLVYVLVGTCVTFGVDFDEAFKRVHASNMTKLGADGKPLKNVAGKVEKGPNYTPPTLDDLVGGLALSKAATTSSSNRSSVLEFISTLLPTPLLSRVGCSTRSTRSNRHRGGLTPASAT